jgi:hexosaminidase
MAVRIVLGCGLVFGAGAMSVVAIEPGLVPKPAKVEVAPGSFSLSAATGIAFQSGTADAKPTAEYLRDLLRNGLGLELPIQQAQSGSQTGILLTTSEPDQSLGREGYHLEVTPRLVTIRASEVAGLFYGVQSFRQLLPPASFGSGSQRSAGPVTIPCVRIVDYPRFAWRGMHLDVSRHFFDVAFVKRYIDNLALHKMNVFHWHLTDDDGWRVEIKQYPKLTEIGAWRGPNEALPPSYESGNQRYGGYYTQDQVREIVRYAAERHVLVVPEADVPAHCRAATVSYPELLCGGDPYKFKSMQDVPANVLCPSQEKTYEFLAAVFGELADLFPGPYLHAGGDERPVGPWEQCPRCSKRMKEEHLADGKILQDRFLKRLQGIIKAKGKRMIGWDELEHESVLDKDYIVMAWNSVEAGIKAAEKGYSVVMTPAPFTYFDLSYNEDPAEPGLRWAGVISVQKAYSYDPKPATLLPGVAERIIGVHSALWSETLVTPDRPDYMAFPRLCALAEIAWTPQDQRAWPEFWNRLCADHLARLDAAGIAYRIPPPAFEKVGSKTVISVPYPGAQVRYTVDGSEPKLDSPLYTKALEFPKDVVLKAKTFRPNGRASRTVVAQPAKANH